MSWGIDEIELVSLAVFRVVIECDALCFDGDATLALQIHRVKNLRSHFTSGEAAANLNQAVRERRFAMVDMSDDGEISYVLHLLGYLRLKFS